MAKEFARIMLQPFAMFMKLGLKTPVSEGVLPDKTIVKMLVPEINRIKKFCLLINNLSFCRLNFELLKIKIIIKKNPINKVLERQAVKAKIKNKAASLLFFNIKRKKSVK